MVITKRLAYGLQILLDLIDKRGETEFVSLKTLSTQNAFSENYLEKIVSLLKKEGILSSSKGVCGGYKLARPICTISLYDIINALEPSILVTMCNEKNTLCNTNHKLKCISKNKCKVTRLLNQIDQNMIELFNQISLKDIENL